MKILCISDQVDPIVYSNSIKERFDDIDIIISAGDLPMEYIDFIVSTLNKPTFFVFGNHNLKDFHYYHKSSHIEYEQTYEHCNLKGFHGATYLGFKTAKEQGLLLAGASGSIRYNKGLNQYTDKEMFFQLLKLVPRLLLNKILYGRYLDIFVTHATPLGVHDKDDPCHKGFKCYNWFLKKFKPMYMVHGHIHLYDLQDIRVSKYEETTVINAYSHYIIEIN